MQPPYPAINRRSAFSLVEMLVAFAVLAVLSTLLIAGVQRARSSAHNTHCISNLRQLGVASALFSQEYDGYMLDVNWWGEELLPYTGAAQPHRDLFWCPAATVEECPSIDGRATSRYANGQLIPIGYGINGNAATNNGRILSGNYGTRAPIRRRHEIENAEKVVLFADQAGGYANLFFNTRDRFSNRHGTGGSDSRMTLNVVFVDGHTESLDMEYSTIRPSPWRSMFENIW